MDSAEPIEAVDNALDDCSKALRASFGETAVMDSELASFVAGFRNDFITALCDGNDCSKGTSIWLGDQPRVLTLARAIGALAAFLALRHSSDPKTAKIRLKHLVEAYTAIKPCCPNGAIGPRREYCTTAHNQPRPTPPPQPAGRATGPQE